MFRVVTQRIVPAWKMDTHNVENRHPDRSVTLIAIAFSILLAASTVAGSQSPAGAEYGCLRYS